MEKFDISIIGGGVLGNSIAYWISELYDLNVCLIEKENSVALHTSSRNTGVLHSPFYLDPMKRKILAKSALLSRDLWKLLSQKMSVPWSEVGTIEVALDESQHTVLEKYMKWGQQNGIPENELELLYGNELKKREPNVECFSGLFCSRDVSTDYGMLTSSLQSISQQNGIKFLFRKNVKNISKINNKLKLDFTDNTFVETSFVINCAGGNSLDIAKQFGLASDFSDLHFRGEYWVSDKSHENLVNTNIYSVARFSEFPFLDPHWIKRAHGCTEIGPNAVPVPTPETYSGISTDMSSLFSKFTDVLSGSTRKLLVNPDFLSLISKEFLSSVSKSAMVARVKEFIPSVKPSFFTKRGTSGIRTPVITPEGKFLPDVMELYDENSYHIINYNSPGASGAPVFSAFVIKKLQEQGILGDFKKQNDPLWDFSKLVHQN